MSFKSKWLIPMLALGLMVLAQSAKATLLPAGGFVSPLISVGGLFTTVADTGPLAYSFGSPLSSGTVEEIVGTFTGNPFGGSDLTFIYQFNVSAGLMENLSGSNYAGFSVDVSQNFCCIPLGTGTVAPLSANRSVDGSIVHFTFSGVTAGETSYLLQVNTNATNFQTGSIGLLDGGGETLAGYAPATPETSSLWLLGLAMGAGLLVSKRMLA